MQYYVLILFQSFAPMIPNPFYIDNQMIQR